MKNGYEFMSQIPRRIASQYSGSLASSWPRAGTSTSTKILQNNQLGWNDEEVIETHLRLRHFAEDWDFPGMEAYDEM